MRESKSAPAAERAGNRDPQLSEITLPFRIICTRHDAEDQAELPPNETRTSRNIGRSLLEPRDDIRTLRRSR